MSEITLRLFKKLEYHLCYVNVPVGGALNVCDMNLYRSKCFMGNTYKTELMYVSWSVVCVQFA